MKTACYGNTSITLVKKTVFTSVTSTFLLFLRAAGLSVRIAAGETLRTFKNGRPALDLSG